ncbi:hypothetical protein SBDP1_1170025 [Syntrophobacter sp. SbD1]|nr:hypothetical protein SBDP1_1170025 [Syntrophobacter sp. SbD1]
MFWTMFVASKVTVHSLNLNQVKKGNSILYYCISPAGIMRASRAPLFVGLFISS